MSFWVHRKPVVEGESRNPPLQPVFPGRGYPILYVELDGFTFEFASLAEIRACIETFEKKVLPRTLDLSREHGSGAGPNSHWLSRLPKEVKSWKYREKAIRYFEIALNSFEEELM